MRNYTIRYVKISTVNSAFFTKSHQLPVIFISVFMVFVINTELSAQHFEPLKDGDSILFIGNSKIGSEGGLQNHFRRTLLRADPPLRTSAYWFNMFNKPALEAMLTGEVEDRLKTGTDDQVIVQSGSTGAMEKFVRIVSHNGKKIAILAAWVDNPFLPGGSLDEFERETRERMELLKKFEKTEHVHVVPAGLIFYNLLVNPVHFKGLRQDYLFVPGSSVQNDLGTLVNVAALYAVTTGKSPLGLPVWDPFPKALVQEIEIRVWETVQSWEKDELIMDPIEKSSGRIQKEVPVLKRDHPHWKPILDDGDFILYVGNSFIGTEGGLENHFPRLLSGIDPPMHAQTSSEIFWGRGLQVMHTGKVREEIASGRNEVVVVTSGPVEYLEKFHQDIEQAGSRMVIHMTWGRNPTINEGGMASFRQQTLEIVDKMQNFEKEAGVPVVPCGLIFYDLVVDPPRIDGLRKDWVFMCENIHQNHIGTMANAAAHYAVMTGCSPVGLPMWDPYPPRLVKAVQKRAWKIIRAWKAGKVVVKELPGNSR